MKSIKKLLSYLKKLLFIQLDDNQSQKIFVLVSQYNSNMVKKAKQNKKTNLDIRSFPISKSKTFAANLNSFIKMLQEHHKHLSSRQYVNQVHQFITRFREKTKAKDLAVGIAKQKIKICRQCDGWCGNKHMCQCTLCEDYYHQQCLTNSKSSFKQYGLCSNCQVNQIAKFDKQTYLHDLMEDRCQKCSGERQDKQAFVQCLRCNQRFHKKCYGKNNAVCINCKFQIDQQLKSKQNLRQATLLEFGCSTNKKSNSSEDSHMKFSHQKQSKYEQQTKTQSSKDFFCYNFEIHEEQKIQKYKQGLMFAILAKNMQYTEKLIPIDCDLDINTEQSLDFGLDYMTRAEYDIYKRYKKQPVAPVKFVYKNGMGYDVVADMQIKQKTLICEYVGQVITLRKCIQLEAHKKNDSLMELRVGCHSDETLIIRPQKYTNMARFINGINNQKGNNKANVATIRKLAKGIPTVILYSIKTIKIGESLLYDYNAGNTNCLYDTSGFI